MNTTIDNGNSNQVSACINTHIQNSSYNFGLDKDKKTPSIKDIKTLEAENKKDSNQKRPAQIQLQSDYSVKEDDKLHKFDTQPDNPSNNKSGNQGSNKKDPSSQSPEKKESNPRIKRNNYSVCQTGNPEPYKSVDKLLTIIDKSLWK